MLCRHFVYTFLYTIDAHLSAQSIVDRAILGLRVFDYKTPHY